LEPKHCREKKKRWRKGGEGLRHRRREPTNAGKPKARGRKKWGSPRRAWGDNHGWGTGTGESLFWGKGNKNKGGCYDNPCRATGPFPILGGKGQNPWVGKRPYLEGGEDAKQKENAKTHRQSQSKGLGVDGRMKKRSVVVPGETGRAPRAPNAEDSLSLEGGGG